MENMNVKNIAIPPREGLDSLLQRIVTSFLFRIPKVRENRNNKLLIKRLRIAPPAIK